MRPWLSLLLATAACHEVWSIDHVGPQAGDAGGDDAPSATIDGGTDGSVVADAALSCPSSYSLTISATTTKYRWIMTPMAWQAAEGACEADSDQVTARTHLAVVTSAGELAGLHAAVGTTEIWLGLSDLAVTGTFAWVTTEPTAYPPATGSPWQNGMPASGGTQHCVKMVGTGEIVNVECTNQPQILCECDAYPLN